MMMMMMVMMMIMTKVMPVVDIIAAVSHNFTLLLYVHVCKLTEHIEEEGSGSKFKYFIFSCVLFFKGRKKFFKCVQFWEKICKTDDFDDHFPA